MQIGAETFVSTVRCVFTRDVCVVCRIKMDATNKGNVVWWVAAGGSIHPLLRLLREKYRACSAWCIHLQCTHANWTDVTPSLEKGCIGKLEAGLLVQVNYTFYVYKKNVLQFGICQKCNAHLRL